MNYAYYNTHDRCMSRGRIKKVKLAERLRELRGKKGVTQSQVAEYLGLKLRAYQYYESGEHRPEYEKLMALADYFDVTTDYLLGRTDEPR